VEEGNETGPLQSRAAPPLRIALEDGIDSVPLPPRSPKSGLGAKQRIGRLSYPALSPNYPRRGFRPQLK
jgi:hypothetical protein